MSWNRTLLLSIVTLCLAVTWTVQGQDKMDTGSIVISPSSKDAQWSPKRKVFPSESVGLTVQVEQTGTVGVRPS